jgi:hypothetical protein
MMVNKELERMWSWPKLSYNPAICLKELRNTMITFGPYK